MKSVGTCVLGASRWTNAFLLPPDNAKIELMVAMSRDQQLANEYYDNFNWPEQQWRRVGSAASIRYWLAERQFRSPEFAAAMANA